MATPYLLPKEAATLGASKRFGLNLCRVPRLQPSTIADLGTENGLVHFELTQSNAPQRQAVPRSARSVVGKAEMSTGEKRPPLILFLR